MAKGQAAGQVQDKCRCTDLALGGRVGGYVGVNEGMKALVSGAAVEVKSCLVSIANSTHL